MSCCRFERPVVGRRGQWFWPRRLALLVTLIVPVITGCGGAGPHADGDGPLTFAPGETITVEFDSFGEDALVVGSFLLTNGASELVRISEITQAVESDCVPTVSTWREPIDHVTGTARARVEEMQVAPLQGAAAAVQPGETAPILFAFGRNDCQKQQTTHYGPVTVDYSVGGTEYRGVYEFFIDL